MECYVDACMFTIPLKYAHTHGTSCHTVSPPITHAHSSPPRPVPPQLRRSSASLARTLLAEALAAGSAVAGTAAQLSKTVLAAPGGGEEGYDQDPDPSLPSTSTPLQQGLRQASLRIRSGLELAAAKVVAHMLAKS